MTLFKLKLGKSGEDLAEKALIKDGYEIIERNKKTSLGEIDIIARHKDLLCFIEVKTRSSTDFGLPEEAVDRTKQKKIILLANEYMSALKKEYDVRFDVVSVLKDKDGKLNAKIIKNAFTEEDLY